MLYHDEFPNPFIEIGGKLFSICYGSGEFLVMRKDMVIRCYPFDPKFINEFEAVVLPCDEEIKLWHSSLETWLVTTSRTARVSNYVSMDTTEPDVVTYSFNNQEDFVSTAISLESYTVRKKRFLIYSEYLDLIQTRVKELFDESFGN